MFGECLEIVNTTEVSYNQLHYIQSNLQTLMSHDTDLHGAEADGLEGRDPRERPRGPAESGRIRVLQIYSDARAAQSRDSLLDELFILVDLSN